MKYFLGTPLFSNYHQTVFDKLAIIESFLFLSCCFTYLNAHFNGKLSVIFISRNHFLLPRNYLFWFYLLAVAQKFLRTVL